MGYLYWPYDEVTLCATENPDTLTVKTPWLEATLTGPLEPRERINLLLGKFQEKTLAPTDIDILQWLFTHFEKYPFCYILPTPKGEGTDNHSCLGPTLENASIEEIIGIALKEGGPNVGDPHSIATQSLSHLPRKSYSWDVDAALTFGKVETGTHPESIFSIARRYHLLELLENDKGKEVFKQIKGLPKDEFALHVGKIVKQNLYVTQECLRSLTPALDISQSARPLIEHFIQQERGHDKLLGAALKALPADPASISVSPQTTVLMSLLRLAAKHNFLAFSIAVDFFERSSYEKTDPLAELLIAGGFADAAKQINRHMEINDAGEHENMGLKFLAPMALCKPDYVREAFKITETISLVMNSVTQSVVPLVNTA